METFFSQLLNLVAPLMLGAIVVEAIINTVQNAIAKLDDWRFWASFGAGLLVGIVISINYGFDLFALAGLEGKVAWIGAALTGVIVGRGSNFANDIFSAIQRMGRPKE